MLNHSVVDTEVVYQRTARKYLDEGDIRKAVYRETPPFDRKHFNRDDHLHLAAMVLQYRVFGLESHGAAPVVVKAKRSPVRRSLWAAYPTPTHERPHNNHENSQRRQTLRSEVPISDFKMD